eukprot:1161979-Pelagomonas_calceolata.AAC.20
MDQVLLPGDSCKRMVSWLQGEDGQDDLGEEQQEGLRSPDEGREESEALAPHERAAMRRCVEGLCQVCALGGCRNHGCMQRVCVRVCEREANSERRWVPKGLSCSHENMPLYYSSHFPPSHLHSCYRTRQDACPVLCAQQRHTAAGERRAAAAGGHGARRAWSGPGPCLCI